MYGHCYIGGQPYTEAFIGNICAGRNLNCYLKVRLEDGNSKKLGENHWVSVGSKGVLKWEAFNYCYYLKLLVMIKKNQLIFRWFLYCFELYRQCTYFLAGACPPLPLYATRWQSDRDWRMEKFLTCFSRTFGSPILTKSTVWSTSFEMTS